VNTVSAITSDPSQRDAAARWALTGVVEAAGRLLERFGLVVLLGVAIATFSVLPSTSDTFATSANLSVIVGNQSVLAIVALGAMIPLVAGQFDLSVGSVAGLCAVVSANWMTDHGAGVATGVAIAVVLGGLVGLINGAIVSYLRVTSLIATLGTTTLIGGVVVQYTSGSSIVGVPASLTKFGSGSTLGLPNTLYVLVVIGVLTTYLLVWTPFGRQLHAVGSNRQAAQLVGIPTVRLTVVAYVLSGVFAGAAGALLVARLGGANPATGFDYTLPALAAVFLGATTIVPGRFNTLGVFVAIFFLAVLSSGLTLAGAADYVQDYVNGGALIIGVAMSALLAARRGGREP
jgi:ribose transport system permease protein